jgi:fructose-1,6-bisphosphatase/inositol monophosphatase family enzyme
MRFTRRDASILVELLRDAARAEIMPRFRNLDADAVREKTSGLDLVTDADEAAERAIEAGLRRAFPGCLVVGEEGVSADPARLRGLGDADLAFILDPVDGTLNFASGLPLFGVMAAALIRGEVVCGIILDPVVDDWAVALRGEGAWSERADGRTRELRVAAPAPCPELTGNASWRYLPEEIRPAVTGAFPGFAMVTDFRCSAHTYRLLAAGRLHFGFSSSVKPWTTLRVAHPREAGDTRRISTARPTGPFERAGASISAPDRETWDVVREALLSRVPPALLPVPAELSPVRVPSSPLHLLMTGPAGPAEWALESGCRAVRPGLPDGGGGAMSRSRSFRWPPSRGTASWETAATRS